MRRRSFVKSLGAGLAGAGLLGFAKATVDPDAGSVTAAPAAPEVGDLMESRSQVVIDFGGLTESVQEAGDKVVELGMAAFSDGEQMMTPDEWQAAVDRNLRVSRNQRIAKAFEFQEDPSSQPPDGFWER